MSTFEAAKPATGNAASPAVDAIRAHLTLRSLQYLRGVAALMVVYFHAVLQLKNLGITSPRLPLFGESGVDLFFVLSGLLMWSTTSSSNTQPLSFLRKRLIRIAPLYWALTLAAGATALLVPHLLKNTQFDFGHFIASLLFIPALNPAYRDGMGLGVQFTPVLVPGWTLNYEMFFYAVFALFVAARPSARLFGICATLLMLTLAGAVGLLGDGPLRFYGNSIMLEFVFGIGIALLIERRALITPTVALGLMMIAASLLIAADLAHAAARVITFGIPAALIVYALCCLELGGVMKNLPLLKWLGDASYSIYLTHIFSLAACRLAFTYLQPQGGINELTFIVVGLSVSALIGVLTYRLYERPVMHGLRSFK